MADVTITVVMIAIVSNDLLFLARYLNLASQLYDAKSHAYFGETRDRISHLLRLTLQTGFLTSALALPIAPLYLIYQDSSRIYDLT